jgi:hypothetical protein
LASTGIREKYSVMNVDRAGLFEEVLTLVRQVNAHPLGRALSSAKQEHLNMAIQRVMLYCAVPPAAETTTVQYWESAVQLSLLLDELDAQLEIVEHASAGSTSSWGSHGLA